MSHSFWQSQWRYEKRSSFNFEGHPQEFPHNAAVGVAAGRCADNSGGGQLSAEDPAASRATGRDPDLKGAKSLLAEGRVLAMVNGMRRKNLAHAPATRGSSARCRRHAILW